MYKYLYQTLFILSSWWTFCINTYSMAPSNMAQMFLNNRKQKCILGVCKWYSTMFVGAGLYWRSGHFLGTEDEGQEGNWGRRKTRKKEREPHLPRSRLHDIWQPLNKTQNLGMIHVNAETTSALRASFFAGWERIIYYQPWRLIRPTALAWQVLLCSMTCSSLSGKLQSEEQHSSGWVWCQGGGFHPTYSCTKGWLWQQFLGYNFINSLFFPDFQCEFRPQHRFHLTSLFCVITF